MLWKDTINQLKNKIEYNIHKAVYDKEAEEYSKNKANAGNKIIDSFDASGVTINTNALPTDISKINASGVNISVDSDFSVGRMIGKIISTTLSYLTFATIPFIILSVGMLVANDMIIYPAPLRIFGFLSTILNPIVASIALIYYLLRALYSTYMKFRGKLENSQKYELPSIFAFLPITSYEASSSIGRFFIYPFNYPKTEEDADKLPKLASEHLKRLEDSFSGFEEIRKNKVFADLLEVVKKEL